MFQPTTSKQNVTIIKTIKTQQSTQNYTTHDDNQKYGPKHMGKRYGTFPLPSRFQL